MKHPPELATAIEEARRQAHVGEDTPAPWAQIKNLVVRGPYQELDEEVFSAFD